MTWLPRLIEKAKKATKLDSSMKLLIAKHIGNDTADFIASAYPERIIALGEVVEAGKKLDEAWGDKASIYAVSNARIVWKDALTRLEELEEK